MPTTGIIFHDLLYVLVNSTKFDHITSLNLTVNRETIDITTFDSSDWRDLEVGTKSWSGSITALYAMDATEGADEAFDDLGTGSNVTILFSTEVTGDTTFTGSAKITSWDYNPSLNSAVEVNISFEGNGALTKGTV